MAYKVIFIDEEQEQQELFQDYMEAVAEQINVACFFPKAEIEEMLQEIDEQHPDAIVTDYLLNDIKENVKYNISYTGVDLVRQYRAMRPNFPCFIITSFDNDAVSETDDVNLIYVKNILNNKEEGVKVHFYDKIREQISKYQKSIESAKNELQSLLTKKENGDIDPTQEQRIIELDDFLEKSLDNYDALPSEIKKISSLDKLTSMIVKVDELLEKIN
jgi:DNA-binding NarL/FixJ family response regulator